MKNLDIEEVKKSLMKHFGTAKTSSEEYRKTREEVGELRLKKFGLE